MTLYAAIAYVLIGSVLGFFVGVFLGVVAATHYCAASPLVRAWWEEYREARERRLAVNEAREVIASIAKRRFEG